MTWTMLRRARAAALLVMATGVASCAHSSGSPLLAPNAVELAKPAPDSFRVNVETSRGRLVVMARRAWAPHGVDRFYYLTRNGYYDSTYFFRVIEDFVAQFGISGDPRVNDAWQKLRLPDDPVRHSNMRGTIAFASQGPDTRSVQLFINRRDNPKLDSLGAGFPPIAEVVDGMSVVDSLYGGYGEGAPRGLGPRQELIMGQGNAYLRRFFPQLDLIVRATVAQEWGQGRGQ